MICSLTSFPKGLIFWHPQIDVSEQPGWHMLPQAGEVQRKETFREEFRAVTLPLPVSDFYRHWNN